MIIDDKIEARFWDKVLIRGPDECWLWLAATDTSGYGIFRIHGKLWKAHRFSYFLPCGDIPHGLCVCHHCDEPLCMNPKHLFLGTARDNAKDRDRKGRGCMPYQVDGGYRVLTPKQAQIVRELYATGNYSQRQLAKELNVSQGPIYKAIHREGIYQ